jgi:hypothetical protein
MSLSTFLLDPSDDEEEDDEEDDAGSVTPTYPSLRSGFFRRALSPMISAPV